MQSSCLAPIKKTALKRNLTKPFDSKLNKHHRQEHFESSYLVKNQHVYIYFFSIRHKSYLFSVRVMSVFYKWEEHRLALSSVLRRRDLFSILNDTNVFTDPHCSCSLAALRYTTKTDTRFKYCNDRICWCALLLWVTRSLPSGACEVSEQESLQPRISPLSKRHLSVCIKGLICTVQDKIFWIKAVWRIFSVFWHPHCDQFKNLYFYNIYIFL